RFPERPDVGAPLGDGVFLLVPACVAGGAGALVQGAEDGGDLLVDAGGGVDEERAAGEAGAGEVAAVLVPGVGLAEVPDGFGDLVAVSEESTGRSDVEDEVGDLVVTQLGRAAVEVLAGGDLDQALGVVEG